MSEDDEKYKLLALRCQAVQKENEEIARQVVKTKRNLCKARRLRMRLLQKLDSIGDSWRQGQVKGISLKTQNVSTSSSHISHPKMNFNKGFSNLDKSQTLIRTLANLPVTNSTNELLSNSNINNNSSEEDFNSSSSDAAALVSTLSSITMPLTIPIPDGSDATFSEHDLMSSCLK